MRLPRGSQMMSPGVDKPARLIRIPPEAQQFDEALDVDFFSIPKKAIGSIRTICRHLQNMRAIPSDAAITARPAWPAVVDPPRQSSPVARACICPQQTINDVERILLRERRDGAERLNFNEQEVFDNLFDCRAALLAGRELVNPAIVVRYADAVVARVKIWNVPDPSVERRLITTVATRRRHHAASILKAGSMSQPMACRPSALAANRVVPPPANGSTTFAPGAVSDSMMSLKAR